MRKGATVKAVALFFCKNSAIVGKNIPDRNGLNVLFQNIFLCSDRFTEFNSLFSTICLLYLLRFV